MEFAGMNHLAIVLAGGASFLFGGVWYNVFGDAWLAAIGKTYEELKAEGGLGPRPMAVALVCQLVMAAILSGALGYLGAENVTLKNGVVAAVIIWAGFVMTTTITNNQFQVQGWRLTLIDGGHWLFVLLIQGAIIGFLGV